MLLLWGPLLAAVLFLPAAALAAVVLALGRVRRRQAWLGWVGVPLGCALLPGVLVTLLLGGFAAHRALRPDAWAYQEVFGSEPGKAITGLAARTDAGLDSRTIYLAFDRNPAALAEVLGSGGFTPPDPSSARVDSLAYDAPDWWRGSATPAWRYCADARVLERASGWWDNVSVIDCPSRRRILVVASNID